MNQVVAILMLTLVTATPLVYAALGGVLCERSGVVNIGLEGILAAAAFSSVVAAFATGSALLGALAGIAAGALAGAIFALAATRYGADQIVAGMGLNLIALGAAAYGLVVVFGQPGASPPVPALGPHAAGALVAGSLLAALLIESVIALTPWGLRVRAAGENPHALAAAGIDPRRIRFAAVTLGGAITACGGVYLALGELDLYSDNMTAGRGFIALAAVILGRWRPLGALAAALGFGFLASLQYSLQRSGIPSELMQALPYLAAILALAGIAGRSRPPASDGLPYVPNV